MKVVSSDGASKAKLFLYEVRRDEKPTTTSVVGVIYAKSTKKALKTLRRQQKKSGGAFYSANLHELVFVHRPARPSQKEIVTGRLAGRLLSVQAAFAEFGIAEAGYVLKVFKSKEDESHKTPQQVKDEQERKKSEGTARPIV